MIKYYKCLYPRQKRYLTDGSFIQFDDVGNNTGIFATDNEAAQREILLMQKSNRGGITDITEAEFFELKKNPAPQVTPWREEWSRAGVERNRQPLHHSPPLAVAEPAADGEPAAPAVSPMPAEAPDRPRSVRLK
jgi:hypothetical protein